MKSISPCCPECIEPLVKQVEKLGKCTNWLVCPKCGYRERPAHEGVANNIANATADGLKLRNNQQNR